MRAHSRAAYLCAFGSIIGIGLFFGLILLLSLPSQFAVANNHKGGTGGNGDHGGKTGPDYRPPPYGDFGGYVWGAVFVDGVPVSNVVITMASSSPTNIVTATTLLVKEIEPYAIYMFGVLPHSIGIVHGSMVTMTVNVPGFPSQMKPVQMIANHDNEINVNFVFGKAVLPIPTVPPRPEISGTSTLNTVPPARRLASGNGFVCGVFSGGAKCWGSNDSGQIGDGTGWTGPNKLREIPTFVTGLTSGVRSIAAGNARACALMETGDVYCWGDGSLVAIISTTPVKIIGIKDAVDIASGYWHSCALIKDGTIKCWGDNRYGQLGIGTSGQGSFSASPVTVTLDSGLPLTGVTRLSISPLDLKTCVIVQKGVKCWGLNANPYTAVAGSNNWIARATDIVPANSGAIEISAADNDAYCAAFVNGDTRCWSAPYEFYQPDGRVFSGLNAVKLSGNQNSWCAITANGDAKCVGNYNPTSGAEGVLGTNAPLSTAVPVSIPGLPTGLSDISVGDRHVCALTLKGDVYCWGNNPTGQLGNLSVPTSTVSIPYLPPSISTAVTGVITQITTGSYQTCYKVVEQGWQCVGANMWGDLGDAPVQHAITTPVALFSTISNAKSIAFSMPYYAAGYILAEASTKCAVTDVGEVWCWGYNNYGQVGDGTQMYRLAPIKINGLTGVKAIVMGSWHGCALLNTGQIKCWGLGGNGQLGAGNVSSSYVPTNVIGLAAPAISIAAGARHTCALLNTGTVQCWGDNFHQQLGGLTASYAISQPLTVASLPNTVNSIAAGYEFTCAGFTTAVKCWGDLYMGSLYTPPLSSPIMVPNLAPGINQIVAGRGHACALRGTGMVQCWGGGAWGVLGDNGITNTVVGITNAISLDARWSHTCAMLANGKAKCWGVDDYGQLGNGKSTIRPTPVQVQNLTPAKWTYMLYLVGDNDLSSYLDNIARVLDTVPSDPRLNIIVLFDGAGKNDTYLWTTKGGGGYDLGLNKWSLVEADTDLGNPDTLAKFVQLAMRNYPAEHYYLSIVNHGRGTTGTGWDSQSAAMTTTTARLTPANIRLALSKATQNGSRKLDIVHFDSCLMAMLEVGYQIKDYAHYMIASENLSAAFYPYDQYARHVLNDFNIEPSELAKRIAQTYFNYEYLRINSQPRTVSVVDLEQIGSVVSASNDLWLELIANLPSVKSAILAARDLAQKADASAPYFSLTVQDEYVDLFDLAERFKSSSVGTIATKASALQAAIQSSYVITEMHESGIDALMSGNFWSLANSHGVAIYFPLAPSLPGDNEYRRYISNSLFTFTGASQWDELLQAVFIEVPQIVPLEVIIPPVLKPTVPITSHCSTDQACVWGAVYSNSLPLQGAIVLIGAGGGSVTTSTAFIKGNEAYPIFLATFGSSQIRPGQRVTVTASHAGQTVSQSLLFAPVGKANEQEVNLTLGSTISSAIEPTTTQVSLVQVFATPLTVTQQTQDVFFQASAIANGSSEITTYRWESSLNGVLGQTSRFELPSSQLKSGDHVITVTAIAADGTVSSPYTFTLHVDAFVFMPIVRR